MRRSARQQLIIAFRAGVAATLAGTLAVVLFLAPTFAGQTNFPGHQHAPGTPDHIHTLEQAAVALGMFEAFVVLVFSTFFVLFVIQHRPEDPHPAPIHRIKTARAPPFFS